MNPKPLLVLVILCAFLGGFNAARGDCEDNPPKPVITVSGAQASNQQNYYVVEIPAQGTTTVTLTASGKTPCPTDSEKCKCCTNTTCQRQDPEKDGDPKYTFIKPVGNQNPPDGPTIKIDVRQSTTPGEYKFQVTKIEQQYKACPPGWTGGVASKSNTQASDEVTILICKVTLEISSTLTVMDGWGLKAKIEPTNSYASNFKFDARRKNNSSWTVLNSGPNGQHGDPARAAGLFEAQLTATIKGVDLQSEISAQIEVQFPSASDIAADSAVSSKRAADWTAASGVSGDHNERGGWIYLNTANGSYRIDAWNVGTFFGVMPSGAPADSGDPCNVAPNGNLEYFVGEYHQHATLRNQNDVTNASQFPTGPSSGDELGARTSIAPSGAPGLVRDRHRDEIVETGHTDHTYGPSRRATPSCP